MSENRNACHQRWRCQEPKTQGKRESRVVGWLFFILSAPIVSFTSAACCAWSVILFLGVRDTVNSSKRHCVSRTSPDKLQQNIWGPQEAFFTSPSQDSMLTIFKDHQPTTNKSQTRSRPSASQTEWSAYSSHNISIAVKHQAWRPPLDETCVRENMQWKNPRPQTPISSRNLPCLERLGAALFWIKIPKPYFPGLKRQ